MVVPDSSHAFKELHSFNTGAAIRAEGVIKESPGKGQSCELEVNKIIKNSQILKFFSRLKTRNLEDNYNENS